MDIHQVLLKAHTHHYQLSGIGIEVRVGEIQRKTDFTKAVDVVSGGGCPIVHEDVGRRRLAIAILGFYDEGKGGKLLSQRPTFRANAPCFCSSTI